MAGDLRVWTRVYGAMLAASVREQMSYRGSFVFELVGRLTVTGLELVALFFLFQHIESIAGWTKWEVVYLYGMASICLGMGEALTTGFDDMPELHWSFGYGLFWFVCGVVAAVQLVVLPERRPTVVVT